MSDQGPVNDQNRILLSRFISSQQWDRALEVAKDLLSSDPEDHLAHFWAAQALINLDRYAEAEGHLELCLAHDPDNAMAHRFLSIVHFTKNKYRAADESIRKALALDPNDPYNWYHIGWMRFKQDDLKAGLKYAEKARELSPRDSDILNLVALCTPKGGEHDGTLLQNYLEALELEPENPQVHNNLGVYYMQVEGDFPKAEACFRQALFFDPSLKVSRFNLFIVIKHRDKVYRFLCWPRDAINDIFARIGKNKMLYYLLFPVWIFACRYLFGVLVLWFLLVWPTVKVYEYLTIGDIQTQAGELGARPPPPAPLRVSPVACEGASGGFCLYALSVLGRSGLAGGHAPGKHPHAGRLCVGNWRTDCVGLLGAGAVEAWFLPLPFAQYDKED
jgi:tetratricopeptide (TPR) repeat protein